MKLIGPRFLMKITICMAYFLGGTQSFAAMVYYPDERLYAVANQADIRLIAKATACSYKNAEDLFMNFINKRSGEMARKAGSEGASFEKTLERADFIKAFYLGMIDGMASMYKSMEANGISVCSK